MSDDAATVTPSQDDTTRPTFAEVFAHDADSAPSSESDTSPASDADPSAAAPRTQPTPSPTDVEPRETRGPIPYDRHEAVLKPLRQQVDDYKAKWDRVGWVESAVNSGLTQENFNVLMSAVAQMATDPAGFLDDHFQAALADPRHGPALQSWAARVLQQSRRDVAAGDSNDAEPKPDLQAPDGTLVYSAAQQEKREQWSKRQVLAEVEKMVGPLKTAEQRREDEATIRQLNADWSAKAVGIYKALETKPHFLENREAIAKRLEASKGSDGQWTISIHQAYLDTVLEDVLPKLSATERAATVADFRRSAAAEAVNPRAGATGAATRPRGFNDPALRW